VELLLYLCATLSLLALFTFGLVPITIKGRAIPAPTIGRVLTLGIVGAVVFVISVAGGYFFWLYAVLVISTFIVARRRSRGEDTYYERPVVIITLTLVSYVGPVTVFIASLWILAPSLPQPQSAELILAFPSTFAKHVGNASFVKLLESKVSNSSFTKLKKIYDINYPTQEGPSFDKILETRDSACHLSEVLKGWDLKTIDSRSKIFLLQLAKSYHFECGIYDDLATLMKEKGP